MRTRRSTCLLIAFLLTSSPAWAACELGLPGEGGCEQQAAQPEGSKGNITAGEWWGGLKSSIKQMGNDISNTARHAGQSLKGNNKGNQGKDSARQGKAKQQAAREYRP